MATATFIHAVPSTMRKIIEKLRNMTTLVGKMYLILVLGLGTTQTPAAVNPGCTVEHGQTTCSWYWFQKSLDAAHLVRAEYKEMDRSTGSQLKDLAKDLGKNVAKNDETADLTFTVVPAAISGMDVGPADEEILELRIYSGGSSQGKLVWLETYRGQKDKPWPANVHAAIAQFKDRVAKKR